MTWLVWEGTPIRKKLIKLLEPFPLLNACPPTISLTKKGRALRTTWSRLTKDRRFPRMPTPPNRYAHRKKAFKIQTLGLSKRHSRSYKERCSRWKTTRMSCVERCASISRVMLSLRRGEEMLKMEVTVSCNLMKMMSPMKWCPSRNSRGSTGIMVSRKASSWAPGLMIDTRSHMLNTARMMAKINWELTATMKKIIPLTKRTTVMKFRNCQVGPAIITVSHGSNNKTTIKISRIRIRISSSRDQQKTAMS